MYDLIRECHRPHTRVKDMVSVTVRTSIYHIVLSKGCTHEGYKEGRWTFLVLVHSRTWLINYLPGPGRGGPGVIVQEHIFGIKRLDRFNLLVMDCKIWILMLMVRL